MTKMEMAAMPRRSVGNSLMLNLLVMSAMTCCRSFSIDSSRSRLARSYPSNYGGAYRRHHPQFAQSVDGETADGGSAASMDDAAKMLEEIRSMRVKALKTELDQLSISTKGLFEKEELVQRVLVAWQQGRKPPLQTTTNDDDNASGQSADGSFTAPLYVTPLDKDIKIDATSMNGDVTIKPDEQSYPSVQMEVDAASPFVLNLVLDTACSGFVVRPSVVEKHNLPKFSNPVTMTGAGGVGDSVGLTQIEKFRIGGQGEFAGRSFGSLPAAVKDINGLPAAVDGIIGLSFLGQFGAMTMDFEQGQIQFQSREAAAAAQPDDASLQTVTEGNMTLLPIGVYSVDVWLGSRGPVKMIVDSGATDTFLNWKGVEDLGLSRSSSSFVEPIHNPMGAFGTDNVAMELTHRIHVSSTLKLGSPSDVDKAEGVSFKGDSKRLAIDIGDIAILDRLKPQGIGGILGIDALLRCSAVRFHFQARTPKMELLMKQPSPEKQGQEQEQA